MDVASGGTEIEPASVNDAPAPGRARAVLPDRQAGFDIKESYLAVPGTDHDPAAACGKEFAHHGAPKVLPPSNEVAGALSELTRSIEGPARGLDLGPHPVEALCVTGHVQRHCVVSLSQAPHPDIGAAVNLHAHLGFFGEAQLVRQDIAFALGSKGRDGVQHGVFLGAEVAGRHLQDLLAFPAFFGHFHGVGREGLPAYFDDRIRGVHERARHQEVPALSLPGDERVTVGGENRPDRELV